MASQKFQVVEMAEDTFVNSRIDDFDARIIEAAYCPYVFPNSATGKHMLFARLTLLHLEDDKELAPEYIQAGFLNSSFPSKDGKTPAGGSVEEYQILAKGEDVIDPETVSDYDGAYVINLASAGSTLPPTDWGQTVKSFITLGQEKFSNIEDLIGTEWHWNRLPQDEDRRREPTAEQKAKGQTREYKVLCATDKLKGKKGGGKAKETGTDSKKESAKETSKSSASSSATSDSDLETEMAMAGLNLLTEAGKPLSKKVFHSDLIKQFPKQMKEAMSLMNSDWPRDEDRPWTWDAEEGEYSA